MGVGSRRSRVLYPLYVAVLCEILLQCSSFDTQYPRSDEEGKAWLNYEADGVDLRANYFAILEALCEHLVAGKAARSVIGSFDEPKLASSILFFERLSRNDDNELNTLLVKIAGLMELQITP